jgi:7-cyano-7-deazaguanine synthase
VSTEEARKHHEEFFGSKPDYGMSTARPDSCAIVSGGLDSTILVYDMLNQGYTPHMLSFNYGQRHKKELEFASNTALRLGLNHDIIDLSGITGLISNSALTAGNVGLFDHVPGQGMVETLQPAIEVPEGHYAEDTMKATVVPNRNMIMLSIAAGVAVNNKYRCIGMGVHGGDHFIYPDCRPAFISEVDEAIIVGNEGFHNFGADPVSTGYGYAIFSPYLNKTKADIAYRGLELGVPFEFTWSCYKGGEKHCGKCGTCVERLEAIDEAIQRAHADDRFPKLLEDHGLKPGDKIDQTKYEDDTFWREAIASRS